jgi:SAM-dependent methyltransferase
MPEYLLHHVHRPERCQEISEAWKAPDAPSGLRGHHFFCSCLSGDHGAFISAEADSPEAALGLLPALLRPTTRVYAGQTLSIVSDTAMATRAGHGARPTERAPGVAIAAQYDPIAQDYEQWVVPKFRPVAEALVKAAAVSPSEQVIEVGAGTGGLSRLILPRLGPTGTLTVTDVSPGMLEIAERVLASPVPRGNGRGARLTVTEADLTSLPVSDGAFDLLLSQFTPLLDGPAGLREALRVLRPGGRLAAAVWGGSYTERALLNAVRVEAGIPPYPDESVSVTATRIREAGFAEVRRRSVRLPVIHDTAETYLAYRAAFGVPPAWNPEQASRYADTLIRRVEAIAPDGELVVLDWQVILFTAFRAELV